MGKSASLRWLAAVTVACAAGMGGPDPARGAAVEGIAALTVEDIQDALDRGELSQAEFEQVVALIEHRQQADSIQLARIREALAVSERPADRESATGAHGQLQYGLRTGIRGRLLPAQYFQFEPHRGHYTARVFAQSSGRSAWYVTEAAMRLRPGAVELEAGSLDRMWTGGLVLGRPPLIGRSTAIGIESLVQPVRSRLWGGSIQLHRRRGEAELLLSSVTDSLWLQRLAGVRVNWRMGSFSWEPALLAQTLDRRATSQSYASWIWGLSARHIFKSGSIEFNSGFTRNTIAFQSRVLGRSSSARWDMAYWTVPTGYRHPLLSADGEPDLEPVPYPELDAYLDNPSTGESGGRLSIRSGSSRAFSEISATVWREQPFRPASLRLRVASGRPLRAVRMRLEYSHVSQPTLAGRQTRHEAALSANYRKLFSELRGQWIWGDGLPKRAAGGRLSGGVRVHTRGAGKWEVQAAFDANDLSLASRQFVTFRVDQTLPFRRGELAVHLRWRSATASQAAALGLRIDSTVFL